MSGLVPRASAKGPQVPRSTTGAISAMIDEASADRVQA